jgi:hypothetical protein
MTKRRVRRALVTLLGILAFGSVLASPVQAQSPLNLTLQTSQIAAIADGNTRCQNQPFYRYDGGDVDNFAGGADTSFPSQNLADFIAAQLAIGAPGGVVDYDVPVNNGVFGDSFNLQNGRNVCHAVVSFRTRPTGDIPATDGLTIGHVGPGGAPFNIVAQVIDPSAGPALKTYALTVAGRALLSAITSAASPLDSILDVFLQDDAEIDFVRLWVWYQ